MKLNFLTIKDALKGLKNREFSSVELVRACLEQIKKYDGKLNAFITVREEEALLEAENADAERISQKKGQGLDGSLRRKQILGVPIAVKDNFLTKGIRTTAGSKVLDNYKPQYESTVTRRLRDAGAIIIGKTNMDAWAHGSSTETSDYETTRNPWNTDYLPGGSSGGSAATVAANMCIAAIGSETAGSIRQPAAWCGCTGLKPSYGRVSRYGVVAMASSTDSPGPLTKTAEDAEIILSIIAGKDIKDATTIEENWEIRGIKDIRKLKIGVIKDYFLENAKEGVNEKVEEAINVLKKDGFSIRETSLLDPKYSIADYTIIQRGEVSSNLARYDGMRYGNGREYFGDEAKRRIMFGTFILSTGYQDKYYIKAQKVRTKILQDFSKVFSNVDVLVAPTSPTTALPVGSSSGKAMFGEMQDVLVEASSMAGLPGISIPAGFIDGLPVGVQFIGRPKEEKSILAIAKRYQERTEWHDRIFRLV